MTEQSDGEIARTGVLYVESEDCYLWEDEDGQVWKRVKEDGKRKNVRVTGNTL